MMLNNLKVCLTAVVALELGFVARATTIYVAHTGSDTDGDGSAEAPFATVEKGIAEARSGDVVEIAPSSEPYVLERKISVSGITLRGGGTSREDVVLSMVAEPAGTLAYGVISMTSKTARIENLTFADIEPASGLIFWIKDGVFADCVFRNLKSAHNLGFLFIDSGTTLTNCLFTQNKSTIIYSYSANGKLLDCEFSDHDGITLLNNSGSFYRCKFLRNKGNSKFKGSAYYDCLFAENEGTPATINSGNSYNCTFVNNIGDKVVGGGTHYNGLFYGNTKTADDTAVASGQNCTFKNCLVPEGMTGGSYDSTCVRCDDPSLEAGTYALTAGSDAAFNASAMDETSFPNEELRTVDLAGQTRVKFGKACLGCYEFQELVTVSCVIKSGRQELFLRGDEGSACSVTVSLSGPKNIDMRVSLDFGDGSVETMDTKTTGDEQILTFMHTYAVGGFYDVEVAAAKRNNPSAEPTGERSADFVRVIDTTTDTIHLATTGSDANSGRTPGAPKATLRSALGAANIGAAVILAEGTYALPSSACAIPAGVTLRGAGATPDAVVLTGTDVSNTAFKLSDANSKIANLTISGLTGSWAGGSIITASAGTIEDCVFTDNVQSPLNGDYRLILTSGSAVISRCRFERNTARCLHVGDSAVVLDSVFQGNTVWSWGGLVAGNGSGGLYRCRFVGNDIPSKGNSSFTITYNVKIYDSLFQGNKSRISYNGATYNCSIIGNEMDALFYNAHDHYNDLYYRNCVGGDGTADASYAGNFYSCLVSTMENGGTFDEACGVCVEPGLKSDSWKPLADSATVNRGKMAHYANAARRATDLTGEKKRVKGGEIDVGCYEYGADALVLVVR